MKLPIAVSPRIALIVIWVPTVALAFVIGSVCQLALWHHGGRPIGASLLRCPLLWYPYFLIAVAIGERLARWLNGRVIVTETASPSTDRQR
jgi:hypothetical protein